MLSTGDHLVASDVDEGTREYVDDFGEHPLQKFEHSFIACAVDVLVYTPLTWRFCNASCACIFAPCAQASLCYRSHESSDYTIAFSLHAQEKEQQNLVRS